MHLSLARLLQLGLAMDPFAKFIDASPAANRRRVERKRKISTQYKPSENGHWLTTGIRLMVCITSLRALAVDAATLEDEHDEDNFSDLYGLILVVFIVGLACGVTIRSCKTKLCRRSVSMQAQTIPHNVRIGSAAVSVRARGKAAMATWSIN